MNKNSLGVTDVYVIVKHPNGGPCHRLAPGVALAPSALFLLTWSFDRRIPGMQLVLPANAQLHAMHPLRLRCFPYLVP